MANKRKPDNVHRLNGTYQKSRHGDPGTKPEWSSDFPDMPGCVAKNDGAKTEWNRILVKVPAGVLTLTDRALLTQYCLLWSQLDEEGTQFSSAKHSQFRLIEADLGFTPISRGKIGGTPKNDGGGGSFGRT